MNREIKFRAWEQQYERWVDNFVVKPNGEVRVFGYGMDGAYKTYRAASQNLILMQYTGLKDKNGVEIYEGDMLLSDDYGPDYAVVTWREGPDCVGWWAVPWGTNKDYFTDCKVIGNVYEHPNLLK